MNRYWHVSLPFYSLCFLALLPEFKLQFLPGGHQQTARIPARVASRGFLAENFQPKPIPLRLMPVL
jgi:hypothetical protein